MSEHFAESGNRESTSRRFTIDSCVRGYHIYKTIWPAPIGEVLQCQPESGNIHDPYCVAVVTSRNVTVGHVPRTISAVCRSFLRIGGSIVVQVTGSRRFSADLVQGGLEIPCVLTFIGSEKAISKVEKLMAVQPTAAAVATPPPAKKSKIEQQTGNHNPDLDAVWVRFNGYLLTERDKGILTSGGQLNDNHINFAQQLLLHQFPSTEGLQYTILQARKPAKKIKNGLQIIHDRGNHWLVASTIGCAGRVVQVYDSIYSSVDEGTMTVIQNFFEMRENYEAIVIDSQKQIGGKDCGVFAIATATAILSGCNLQSIKFVQEQMRSHLLDCLNSKLICTFPSINSE